MSDAEWTMTITLAAIFFLYSSKVWSEYETASVFFSMLCGVFLALAFFSHFAGVQK
jgi:hypothetical protein